MHTITVIVNLVLLAAVASTYFVEVPVQVQVGLFAACLFLAGWNIGIWVE